MMKEAVHVGGDVAKNSLDVAVSNSEEVRQPVTAQGIILPTRVSVFTYTRTRVSSDV